MGAIGPARLGALFWFGVCVCAAPGAPARGVDGEAAATRAEPMPAARAALAALEGELGAPATIAWRRATGVARSLRLPAAAIGKPDDARRSGTERALRFLERHGALFGLGAPRRELTAIDERRDRLGFRRVELAQTREGVPVFGARLVVLFDRSEALRSIVATTVPLGALETTPRIDEAAARRAALGRLAADVHPSGGELVVESSRLAIFALGLDRGADFVPHLAWEIVAGDGGLLRERLFVDAVTGKPLDALPLVFDELERRTFTGRDQAPFDGVPDSYPDQPDWVEGDAFPTGEPERDAALEASAATWDLFAALGRDSWDGEGAALDLSWNRASFCPNASWNGRMTSFCSGFAVHDVVVHEWAHAYTQETHDLIYRWQSGALNEAYSDLWGELADQGATLASGRDVDAPSARRADESCSGFVAARLRIVSPPDLAGDRTVGLASFGPPATSMPASEIVRALDGEGRDPYDACEPLVNAVEATGAIVLANRGTCRFETQARHAQAAGAVGLLIANTAESANPEQPPAMGCHPVEACDLAIAIPALSLALSDGEALAAALAAPAAPAEDSVRGALEAGANQGSDDSVRWLLGEDVRPLGVGRDMWKPSCFGDPDRVTDPLYRCSTADNGGVHSNSGIPNRAFALLVDGGRAHGVEVPAIGRARAAHLYFRAQTTYQLPYSDFSDHADALEAACADLVGVELDDPFGGPPVGFEASHCAAVAAAIAAVELRAAPPCSFAPLLAKEPPPLCPAFERELISAGFDAGADGFVASRRDVAAPDSFEPRDWTRVAPLPEARAGSAFFAPDPHAGSCVSGVGDDDESGVLVLDSPLIAPVDGRPLRIAFDHLLATETDWDGGNLKLAVEGGPWQLVPQTAFHWNGYTGALISDSSFNSNPLAGELAFHGYDEGSNSGSWGRSIVDLSSLVPPGRSFRLRFELGSDECVGSAQGWYVDDVRVVACIDAPELFADGFERGDTARWSD